MQGTPLGLIASRRVSSVPSGRRSRTSVGSGSARPLRLLQVRGLGRPRALHLEGVEPPEVVKEDVARLFRRRLADLSVRLLVSLVFPQARVPVTVSLSSPPVLGVDPHRGVELIIDLTRDLLGGLDGLAHDAPDVPPHAGVGVRLQLRKHPRL